MSEDDWYDDDFDERAEKHASRLRTGINTFAMMDTYLAAFGDANNWKRGSEKGYIVGTFTEPALPMNIQEGNAARRMMQTLVQLCCEEVQMGMIMADTDTVSFTIKADKVPYRAIKAKYEAMKKSLCEGWVKSNQTNARGEVMYQHRTIDLDTLRLLDAMDGTNHSSHMYASEPQRYFDSMVEYDGELVSYNALYNDMEVPDLYVKAAQAYYQKHEGIDIELLDSQERDGKLHAFGSYIKALPETHFRSALVTQERVEDIASFFGFDSPTQGRGMA